MAAVAEVVLEVVPQPPPPPREPAAALRDLAVRKLIPYLCIACTWVGCASVAASTVARRASGEEDSPLAYAFIKVSIGALIFLVMILLVATVWLLRVMCAAGFGSSLRSSATEIQIQSRKVSRQGNAAPPSYMEKSQRGRIGYALFDVGVLGAMAMFCFVIIPSGVLKLWRSK
ncbi:hypothetical protein BAE44_0002142 [Dichanthelium oligosanthes]|uniref:Uncharacterized protein n=1 Tax=Dichanthelium oligosanthes TaxID=888268 RepID=A0A1E5WHG2_9POAL|nr:hypothetical protein BAE44_0002142 [Dichanthelium oligosanthes]